MGVIIQVSQSTGPDGEGTFYKMTELQAAPHKLSVLFAAG
jgi:hypothetical protein